MSNINIDFNKKAGKIKIMHAVNNGPHVTRGDQVRGNQGGQGTVLCLLMP